MDLLGATQGVIGIPLDFFTAIPSDDITAPENLTELIEGVLFSDNFDFRELATIELTPENISNIAAGIDPILPDDEIGAALRTALASGNSLIAGGFQDDGVLAEIGLTGELQCSAKVNDIPILGSVTVRVTLDDVFGVKGLKDTRRGIELAIYGVDTNYGRISKIFLEGTELKIRVGLLTIPIDLAGGDGGDGGGDAGEPPVESLSCG